MTHEHQAAKTTRLSLLGNVFLALIKWLTGYFGNSYALIADAIESTSDIFASFLVLFGLKYSNKPADKNHPYGHGKAEPLITFLVVVFLMSSATIIAYVSIQNIRTPHDPPKAFTLIVLGVIIVIKELFYRIVSKKGKEIKSTALKGEAWHHRSDALTSLAAFIGISIALIFGKGYESADDWAALLAAVFIFYNSYLIFRPALGEVMDEHLHDDVIADIRKIATTVEGVIDTEKCFVRKFGIKYHADIHVVVNNSITVKEGHEVAHRLAEKLKTELPEIESVFTHIEPNE
ncbi:MAG: cation diffusion facilitator family transporter [Bacteroidota bacterium]|nr:cation diffusion facilitator family transporter [Bacteroidota bacterium]